MKYYGGCDVGSTYPLGRLGWVILRGRLGGG